MTQPVGYHLAEFNFGTLAHDWEDPRIDDFRNGLAQVNAIAARLPGFIWRLDDDAMEAVQQDPHGPLADRPNTASALSVWDGPGALWYFVEKTLHARFMVRAHAWFVPDDSGFFVGWWVPVGHRPSVAEGMRMWQRVMADGPSDAVFGTQRVRELAALDR